MTAESRKKLADPQGMIARIRNRLSKNCVTRRSPFVDYIISMRMQGVPFLEIERWPIQQGQEYRIAASTLCRQLNNTKLVVDLTYAEAMLEKRGEFIEINVIREISNNIVTQKLRIDQLVKAEQDKRGKQGYESYSDKRIRAEMIVYNDMLAKLHNMLKELPEGAARAARAEAENTPGLVQHVIS